MPTARPRRRTVPWYVAIGLCLVAVFAISAAGDLLDEKVLYPWSDTSGGRAALVGTWLGEMRTGRGLPRGVYLDMDRYRSTGRRRCGNCPNVEGNARMCDERGLVRTYALWGTVENRGGSSLRLGLTPEPSPPPDGLSLSHLRGTWDGADALAMQATLHLRRGQSAISSSDDPDTGRDHALALQRGTEEAWRALCARLRGLTAPRRS
jgi:hypothetical protein